MSEGDKKTQITKQFDMIHVTPPQSAPDFIKQSPLANASGWMDVNPKTLQSVKYANIFGLGDVAGTANAKTAAAVRKQVPVVVDNILALMNSKAVAEGYDGYGSCPADHLLKYGYVGRIFPTTARLPHPFHLLIHGKTAGFGGGARPLVFHGYIGNLC